MILDGFERQEIPLQCPNCRKKLTSNEVIATGIYSKKEAAMLLGYYDALGFECNNCNIKSACHITFKKLKELENAI